MAPQLARACTGLPVFVVSGGGMNSVTLIRDQAKAIVADGRESVIVYVGDLDDHGETIEDRLADDLAAFVEDLGGEPPRFVVAAITVTQAESHGLPQNPEKPGQWQAEALPPDVLAQVVRQAVEAEVDADALEQAHADALAHQTAILEDLDELGS
jgi:hypothetical protein